MKFLIDESGQGMVEYALIIGLIALVIIVAVIVLGRASKDKLNEVATELTKDYS